MVGQEPCLCSGEIKTKTKPGTVKQAEKVYEELLKAQPDRSELLGDRIFCIEAGSDLWYTAVPSEHRVQLLHQCFVTGTKLVLYVVAKEHEVIYAAVVAFDESHVNALEKCLSVWEELLAWAHPDEDGSTPAPPECFEETGHAAMLSHIAVARALDRKRKQRSSSLPEARTLKSAITALYSMFKGGVDAATAKLMALMPNVNCDWEGQFCLRAILMVFVNIFIVCRIMWYIESILQKLDLNPYSKVKTSKRACVVEEFSMRGLQAHSKTTAVKGKGTLMEFMVNLSLELHREYGSCQEKTEGARCYGLEELTTAQQAFVLKYKSQLAKVVRTAVSREEYMPPPENDISLPLRNLTNASSDSGDRRTTKRKRSLSRGIRLSAFASPMGTSIRLSKVPHLMLPAVISDFRQWCAYCGENKSRFQCMTCLQFLCAPGEKDDAVATSYAVATSCAMKWHHESQEDFAASSTSQVARGARHRCADSDAASIAGESIDSAATADTADSEFHLDSDNGGSVSSSYNENVRWQGGSQSSQSSSACAPPESTSTRGRRARR